MLIAGFFLTILGTAVIVTLGLVVLIAGVLSIGVAWGLLKVKRWTWLPGVIQGLLVLVLGSLFTSFGFDFLWYGIPALLLGFWTVYLFTRTYVKSYLGHK